MWWGEIKRFNIRLQKNKTKQKTKGSECCLNALYFTSSFSPIFCHKIDAYVKPAKKLYKLSKHGCFSEGANVCVILSLPA